MGLLFLLPATFAVYYFAFKAFILKFNVKTPGRGDDDDEIKLMTKKEYKAIKEGEASPLAVRIVEAFGGKENIDNSNNQYENQ